MRQHKLPHLHIRPWNQITYKWTILYINSPTNCASIAPKIQQCPSFNYTIITIYDPWNYYPFLSVFDCNKTISIGIFSTDISVVVWIGNFCHRFFGIFKRIYRNSSFNLTFFQLCVCGFDNERNFFPFFSIFFKFVFTVFRQHFGKRSIFPINLLKYYCYLSLHRR